MYTPPASMDANGQSCSDDSRRPASKRQQQGEGQASVSGTGQPGLVDGPLPPFQQAHLDAWMKLMRRKDFDLFAGAVRTEQIRRGSGSTCAAANKSTLLVCAMRQQQTPARVRLSNFPPEILSLIFACVDTTTLLGAVLNVCRDWRDACADDVYGPKVRLELRIQPECLGLWVAATVGRFAWVIDLDLSRCDMEDGVLECAGSLRRISSLNLSCCAQITDTGLEHVAQLMQLTSLGLWGCNITDTGLEHVAQLTQLNSLSVHHCAKITDTGLEHVGQLTQLTSLNLGSCDNITDTGVGTWWRWQSCRMRGTQNMH